VKSRPVRVRRKARISRSVTSSSPWRLPSEVALEPEVGQQARHHLGHRERPVDHAGGDGAARHGGMAALLRVLRDRQAAPFLDPLDADGAVALGARQHHRRAVRAVRVGQRAEQQVHGDGPVRFGVALVQRERVAFHANELARRDHVDGARAHRLVPGQRQYRQRGAPADQFGQRRFLSGVELDRHHERDRALGRHVLEESLQRFDRPGRAAQRDDRHQLMVAAGRDVVVAGRLVAGGWRVF